MKKAICSIAAVLLGATGWTQETGSATEDTRQASAPGVTATNSVAGAKREISELNKASSFVGASVMNEAGKEIGKVRDVVFDLEKAELGYVVIALGSSETSRNVPVPARSLKIAEGKKHLVLNMSESILAAAEGVADGAWPATDVFAVGGPAEAETGSGSSTEKAE